MTLTTVELAQKNQKKKNQLITQTIAVFTVSLIKNAAIVAIKYFFKTKENLRDPKPFES